MGKLPDLSDTPASVPSAETGLETIRAHFQTLSEAMPTLSIDDISRHDRAFTDFQLLARKLAFHSHYQQKPGELERVLSGRCLLRFMVNELLSTRDSFRRLSADHDRVSAGFSFRLNVEEFEGRNALEGSDQTTEEAQVDEIIVNDGNVTHMSLFSVKTVQSSREQKIGSALSKLTKISQRLTHFVEAMRHDCKRVLHLGVIFSDHDTQIQGTPRLSHFTPIVCNVGQTLQTLEAELKKMIKRTS
jgi:hypothetical protein